jgi:outer membrane lipoprotein-sorting protein
MIRRRILAAALLLPALPALAPREAQGQTQGRAAPPPAPAPAAAPDPATLARIEAYLNGLASFRARFLQLAQNGASATGTAWIVRPGRMRFDYDPPEPTLLIASGGQVLLYDRDLRQPSIAPASSTPLGMLLRPEIRLAGDITVTGLERRGGFLHLSMHRTGQAAEGRLTLSFSEAPMQLRQWSVLDAQGRETRVTLYEIDTATRPNLRMFDFNDPRFFEEEQQRR